MEKINEYKEGFRRYADSTPAGAKIIFNMVCKGYERIIEEQKPKGLDYNELFKFMQEFGIDILNSYGELIIDKKTNIYTFTTSCNDLDDVKTRVVYSLCRPIGKGLELQDKSRDATRLLKKLNDYFKTKLTKDDMLLMYQDLCYERKLPEFKDFIKRGFPMDELKGEK